VHRGLSVIAGTLTMSLLTACSPASLLGRLQPAAAGGEVRDVAYAPSPRHAPDIGPRQAPDIGPLHAPDIDPRDAPDIDPRHAPDNDPPAAPGASPRDTPDISKRDALDISPRHALDTSARDAPDTSPPDALDISPRHALDISPRHALDIYVPARGERPRPVVVFFYGGGWTSGDRRMYRFVGRSLAACGALTFIPDYRVWPETGFSGFLQDAAAAVAFAREAAPRYGGDPSRLFLIGHSAGAYIAAMLALDPEWLAGAGVNARTALSGVVGLAGPYDFLPLNDPVLERIFAPDGAPVGAPVGAPAGPRTQPITFAANARAPLLLIAGESDTTVRPANSTRLAARVREAGGNASTILYPGVGHIGLVAALAPTLRFLAPVRADTCRFLGLAPLAAPAIAASAGVVAR
jgi:acetyl esterase/lipase